MSLKKDVFRCTVVYDHEQKESAPIEIDAKRVNNTVTLSLVITNQTPEKGLISQIGCSTRNFKGTIRFSESNRAEKYSPQIYHETLNFYVSHPNHGRIKSYIE